LSGGGLYDSGTIAGTTISGGFDEVFSGATASGTIVDGGGIETVFAGGIDSGTILRGGTQYVFGTASGTVLSSGGSQVVASGGTVNGTSVDSGGYEFVASGGLAIGTMISGGTMEVASGGSTGVSPVTFSSGGELKLDASVSFSGTISGFHPGDFFDLADIAFGSGTTLGFSEAPSNTSGTLTVNDGTHTANITLLGQYVAGQFTLASDGNGGTLIGDPSVASATDPNPIATATTHHQ
jgi:autotransporter passenger strand-loop-strand repeat protein